MARTETGLAASRLGFSRAARTVFEGIDFCIGPGDLLQVMGPNGSGKTSLLRVLSGLLQPDAGELRWQSRPVRPGEPGYLQCVAYVGHANGIDPDLGAAENLRFAMRMAGLPPDPDLIHRALAAFDMAGAQARPVRMLSQGQRRRVALARLAVAPRTLWLLDEPLAFLDKRSADAFQDRLDAHLRAGGMAVVATHEPLPIDGGFLHLDG